MTYSELYECLSFLLAFSCFWKIFKHHLVGYSLSPGGTYLLAYFWVPKEEPPSSKLSIAKRCIIVSSSFLGFDEGSGGGDGTVRRHEPYGSIFYVVCTRDDFDWRDS